MSVFVLESSRNDFRLRFLDCFPGFGQAINSVVVVVGGFHVSCWGLVEMVCSFCISFIGLGNLVAMLRRSVVVSCFTVFLRPGRPNPVNYDVLIFSCVLQSFYFSDPLGQSSEAINSVVVVVVGSAWWLSVVFYYVSTCWSPKPFKLLLF